MKNLAIIASFAILVSCAPGDSDEAASENEAGSSQEELKTLAVEVKEIEPEFFSRYFEVTGHMEAVQDAYISPEINGQIKKVNIERGARVRKGELLIRLNTEITEKNIEEVKTSLDLARKIYEKQEGLWEQNVGSELQYLEAKNGVESLEARLATLEKQLQMAQVRAPFSGIVDDILVKEGELASPGMRLIHLINLSTMRVSARVSEAYLNSIGKGDLVELRFSSYPDDILRVPVTRLGEMIDMQTRTFALEVVIKNQEEKYKPNMITSVRIVDFTDNEALVVPTIVLRQDFKGTFLFRAKESGNALLAEKIYVEPGITVQDKTAVSEGLTSGDKVIIRGYNLVGDGSPVRITNL